VVSGPSHGTVNNNGNGSVTYTPFANYSGPDLITYEVCDTTAPTPLCDTATFTITVTGVPDAPVADNDAATTPEDTPVVISVTANDTDADNNIDPAGISIVSGLSDGLAIGNENGTVTYTPDANFHGTDVFTYEVCDTTNLCDTAVVTITIVPINDPPTAIDDSATVDEDSSVTIEVLPNDSDVDGSLSHENLTILSGPFNGSAVLDPATGSIEYTPAVDYHGPDGFTYQICDDQGGCDVATVAITVVDMNDPPVRINEVAIEITLGETPDPLDFIDPDTDVYSVTLVGGAIPPGLSQAEDGTFTGTASVTGSFVGLVEVCDVHGACTTSAVEIQVLSSGLSQLPFTGPEINALMAFAVLLLLLGVALSRINKSAISRERDC
jgi:hypothetical protein